MKLHRNAKSTRSSRLLLGLNRQPVAPAAPIQRYEWPRPGDMIHVDIKPPAALGASGTGSTAIVDGRVGASVGDGDPARRRSR